LLEFIHFFEAGLPDLDWRHVKVLDKLVLQLFDLFVVNSARTKRHLWLQHLACWRCLHILCQKARLLENESKVDQSVEGENLVHVVDT